MNFDNVIFCFFVLAINLVPTTLAVTKCVRVVGNVECPTDRFMASGVRVLLVDKDALPWETDDLMGENVTDTSGAYIVEGCGDDMFSWNDPDPYIQVKHRCPAPGHSVSISFRTKEIELERNFLPESVIYIDPIRLDV